MCTLILLHRVREDLPVVIAANRDELYARPAKPPQRLLDDPVTAGGLDVPGGGTWLGVTRAGVFCAVTNHHPSQPPDPARGSRGELVLAALRRGSPGGVLELMRATPRRAYNPFNLVFGDAEGAWIAYARDDAPEVGVAIEPVRPGLSVIANDRLDSPQAPRVARVRELVEPAATAPWPTLRARLIDALSDHTTERPVCVHTEHYGTRSASLIAIAPGAVVHYEHAEGRPCTTPFADVTPLLR